MKFTNIILLLLGIPLLYSYPQLKLKSKDILNTTQIIDKINRERKINAFHIVNADVTTKSCLSDAETRTFSGNTTVSLLQTNTPCANLFSRGNDKNLLICCLSKIFLSDLLKNMVSCLGTYRHIRILFIWNTEYTTASSLRKRHELQHQQQLLFEYCAQMRLLNVISIYHDYVADGHFYTFSYFPQFHVQRKSLEEDFFPDRIRDIKGVTIRTAPDLFEPWSIVWRNQYGTLQLGGYLIKILREFTTKINGKLALELNMTDGSFIWAKLLQNDTVDIITGIAPPDLIKFDIELSATLQPVDWMILLPMPPLVTDSEMLLFILNSILGLSILILFLMFSVVLTLERALRWRSSPKKIIQLFLWMLTNVVLRCVIGQPSCSKVPLSARIIKRFLYCYLFASGIFVSTFLSAGLQSYSTRRPFKYSRLRSFKDLVHFDIPIKVSKMESQIMPLYIGEKATKMLNLVIEPSHVELQRQRSALDGRYAYISLSPLLTVLSRYQSHLPRPVYYWSEQIYLAKCIPMSMPMQKHSIYKKALNKLINQIQSTGLAVLWMSQSYDDMIAAKKLNTTIRASVLRDPMNLNDFHFLWWMYCIGMSIAIIIFFAELWHKNLTTKKVSVKQRTLKKRAVRARMYI